MSITRLMWRWGLPVLALVFLVAAERLYAGEHPAEHPGNVFRIGPRDLRLGLFGPQFRDPFDPLGRRQFEQLGPSIR